MQSVPQPLLTAIPRHGLCCTQTKWTSQTQDVLLQWQPGWAGFSSIIFILAVLISPATANLLEDQGVPPRLCTWLHVPKTSSAVITDHSHSGLGFMAHWQHSWSACEMPSTKSPWTHHFHLSVHKTIQLVNFVWMSFMLSWVSDVAPSACTKPHPLHMLHIVCFVEFNSLCQHTHMHVSELNMHIW